MRPAPVRRPDLWPRLPAGLVRACLAGHSALGLALGALAYLICVTGTLVVFADELRRWEQPAAPESAAITPEALSAAARAAFALAGERTVRAITVQLPTTDVPRTSIAVSGEGLDEAWYAAPDGRLAVRKATTWTDFAAELHMKLHLPGLWGYLIVGFAGVGMLGLAVSGLLAHPRILKDAFTLRWGGSKRLQEADLHNRLSVWGAPFNVIISTTGAYFGLVGVLVMAVAAIGYGGDRAAPAAAVRPPAVKADPRPAPPADIAEVVGRVKAEPSAGAPFSVTLSRPGTAGQFATVYSAVPDRLVYGEIHQVRGDGPPAKVGWSDGPFGVQLYASAYALHFGDFGGLWVKGLYFVLGFALCVVCSSGVAIWLARRRDRGRPAPFWERMWAATAWGVPIALAVSAIGTLALGAGPLPVFWLALGLVYATGVAAPDAVRLSAALKLFLGACLATVVFVHLVRSDGPAFPAVAGVVDAVLLALGVGLVVWPLLTGARPRPDSPRPSRLIQERP